MAQPQSFFRTVEHEGQAAERRLGELGLSLHGLASVVEQGESARAQATANDPLTAPSHDAWRYRVRGLRETYCVPQFMWSIARDQGLEMILSVCGRRTVLTRAGDKGVGIRGTHPQPKNEFGDVTAKRVSANGSLYLDADWMNVGKLLVSGNETWILLVHREGDEAFSELSLPSGIAGDGRVEGWIERILLPTIDLANPTNKQLPVEPVAVEDVPVIRKQRQ